MLSARAILEGNTLTLLDQAKISANKEYDIIITFLDANVTLFDGLNERDVLRQVSIKNFELTEHQIELLPLVQQGMKNEEIARKMKIGTASVRNQLSKLYAKFGVRNRTGAIALVREYHLLD